jgi:aspartyl-tRNA(Asn)/glutamyl-tRNA(Gln) amidotransferase subunit A
MPAISVPCGFSDGLPVGLQIMGPAFGEPVVLRVAAAYEAATDWRERRPAVIDQAAAASAVADGSST